MPPGNRRQGVPTSNRVTARRRWSGARPGHRRGRGRRGYGVNHNQRRIIPVNVVMLHRILGGRVGEYRHHTSLRLCPHLQQMIGVVRLRRLRPDHAGAERIRPSRGVDPYSHIDRRTAIRCEAAVVADPRLTPDRKFQRRVPRDRRLLVKARLVRPVEGKILARL